MRFLVVAMVLAVSAPAFADKSQPGALNRCAKLLPQGKDYTVKVEGTVRHEANKTTAMRTVIVGGTHTVVLPKGVKPPADSGDDAEAFGREIDPFQKCLEEHL
jgi:hypothetical protein